MPGLLTTRPLVSASKAAASSTSSYNRSAAPAMTKTQRTTSEEKVDDPISSPVTLLRVLPPKKKNMYSAAVFRPSSLLHACAPATTRPTTDVAEVAAPEKGNPNLYAGGLQSDRRIDSHYSSSSGSEHEPSSVCLAAMVHEFMEEHEGENAGRSGQSGRNCEAAGAANHSSESSDDGKSSFGGELSEILQGLTACTSVTERILLSEVTKALNAAAKETTTNKQRGASTIDDDEVAPAGHCSSSSPRRAVMKHLRSTGYNAAICKSRWDHAGGFPGGDYKYIDAILFESSPIGGKSSESRLLIDTGFRMQFEIARPTKQYNALVQALPAIFVGREDRLQQIVNLMSDSVKASLKKRGMPLPPWRKPEYMRAKWFSSYKRTTNQSVHNNSRSRVGGSSEKAAAALDSSNSRRDISCIAVRGNGWDSKYTDEMEILGYQKAQARQIMKKEMMMRKGHSGGDENAAACSIQTLEDAAFFNRPVPGSERRGDDDDNNNSGLFSSSSVEPVIENMNWELPAVQPRVRSQRPALAGLAVILKEAGLTSSNTRPKEEQTTLHHHRRSLAIV